jgi:hypothetical protein
MKIDTVRCITDLIKKMEIDLNLFNDDTYSSESRLVWEAARHSVGMELLDKFDIKYDVYKHIIPWWEKSLFNKFKFVISTLINITIRGWLFLPRKKEWLIFQNARRKLNDVGLYTDIYTDDIIAEIGIEKCSIVESMYNRRHFVPCPYKIKYLELSDLLAFIYRRFNIWRIERISEFIKMINDIDKYLSFALRQKIDLNVIMYNVFMNVKSYQKSYQLLLNYLKPKKILLVCSYGKEALIDIAHNMKIPVIEVQHGLINNEHLGYSLPLGNKKKSFPDYIWLQGIYWKQNVNWTIQNDRLKILGYPFFTYEYRKYSKKNKIRQILFISQDDIGYKLSKVAIDVALRFKGDIPVIYKLHPSEYEWWNSEYPWLADAEKKEILRILDKDVSLHEIAGESKWVVGVHSTALFEALSLECIIVLFNFNGIEDMEYLIRNKLAVVIGSIDDFTPEEYNTANIESNIFFDKNWKKNLNKLLKEDILSLNRYL